MLDKERLGKQVDGIVVGNIGAGVRIQLQRSGLRAFRAQGTTVRKTLIKSRLTPCRNSATMMIVLDMGMSVAAIDPKALGHWGSLALLVTGV